MLTTEERQDLSARLEQIIGEYAAASDRTAAVAKVQAAVDRVAEPPAAPAEEAPPAGEEAPAEEAPVAPTESVGP